MIAIYFTDGEVLVGNFQGNDYINTRSLYRFESAEQLQRNFDSIRNIRLMVDGMNGYDNNNEWWYRTDKIVRYKDITDEEIKQLRRDGKLKDLGI